MDTYTIFARVRPDEATFFEVHGKVKAASELEAVKLFAQMHKEKFTYGPTSFFIRGVRKYRLGKGGALWSA